MKVAYSQEAQPGYGALIFTEEIFPEGPWAVAIQRGSDQQFLSGNEKNPWTGEAIFLPLAGSGRQDGSLVLEIGPEIVDRLDQQEAYRARLKGASGEPLQAGFRVGSISHSPAGSLKNTARPEPEKTAPEQAPHPAPEPKPAPQPEPETAPERLDLTAEKPQSGNGKKYLRLAMLLVLIAACVAWYVLDPRKNSQDEPAAISKTAPAGAEEQVRQFFKSSDMTPKGALDLAARLPKATTADQDAVYRLYYYAAENNEPGAGLLYGACLDPVTPAWGTIEKNAVAAWNAYRKAPDQEKAATAMTAMRGWLEEQSQAGNRQAARWLAEIEK